MHVCPFSSVLSLCPSLSHSSHSLRVPLRWTKLPNLSNSFTDLKKKKEEALNMSAWHLSVCRGCHQVFCVRGQQGELSSLSGMCNLHTGTCMWLNTVTFRLFKITLDDCLISAWLSHYGCTITAALQVIPPPDRMDLTVKSRHPFTVGALTGLLWPITTHTHKVALSHLQVILNQPTQRSGLLFHSSLWSKVTVWYAEDAPLTVIAGDNYLVWPGKRLERPAGTELSLWLADLLAG